MAKVFIEESTLVGISDSIRAKTGSTGLIKPGDWAAELDNIKSSGKYLWSKKGMVQNDDVLEGTSGTKTLVTANASIPSVEIEYSDTGYEYVDGTYKLLEPTVVTLVNTDTDIPVPSDSNFEYARLTSEPNIIYRGVRFTVGTMNSSGTVVKSMSYSAPLTYELSDILGYTVSDDFSAYPDGGWQDGYYYEVVSGLIEFTIDGTTYQAVEGMTWGEWVESEYNTDGWTVYLREGWINKPNGDTICLQNEEKVHVDEVIMSDYKYIIW